MVSDRPPVAGTVLRYNYLWKREADQGQSEGRKDRPVALILTRGPAPAECVVLPITHAPPDEPAFAIEIPDAERTRLGLDDDRQWVVCSEFNVFVWPGPDLRPVPARNPSTVVYGAVSKQFYTRVLAQVQTLIRARKVKRVSRI